jgi:putrescine aminotransferase
MGLVPAGQLDARHHLHPFSDPRVLGQRGARVMVRGEGVFVEDSEGKRYLDGMAGLWCVQVGYGRPELIDAARGQMERLAYYNTFFGTTSEPVVQLVEMLRERTPQGLDDFVFANSGSEAVDSAVRLLRHYQALCGRPNKQAIIGRELGYHGSTMAAASVGGMAKMHAQGGLPLPDFHHVMPPYAFEYGRDELPEAFARRSANALEAKILELGADRVAAFFAEPLMGAGGVILPPPGYWAAIQEICRRHDVLLVADEVICGFGRTGRFWGSETYGIAPDAMTMAKGLTSGYMPLSALALSEPISEVLRRGGVLQHGFTYSVHPTAAAVAVANLEVIEREHLVEEAGGARSRRLQRGLADLARTQGCVGEARGVGMIGALELARPTARSVSPSRFDPPASAAPRLFDICQEEGLIVRAIRESIAVCPPLTISDGEIDTLLERLGRGLVRLEAELSS